MAWFTYLYFKRVSQFVGFKTSSSNQKPGHQSLQLGDELRLRHANNRVYA